jgi:hemoglobin/transferrin/lactoferrin receptor protein
MPPTHSRRAGLILLGACIALPCVSHAQAPAPDSAQAAPVVPAPDSVVAPPLRPVKPAPVPIEILDTLVTLPPVDVHGDRSVVSGRETATQILLDRAAVTRFQPGSVGDALVSVPGVNLVKTGPWATQLSMRGLTGSRVLLMVDGVRVNSARGHGVQPSLVSVDRLDGVELLPGPSGAQFGSDALGGVVNLVTHRSLFADRPEAHVMLAARGSQPGRGHAESARFSLAGPRAGLELWGGLAGLAALSTPQGEIANSGNRDADLAARASLRLGRAVVDYERTRHEAHDVGLPAFTAGTGTGGVYPLQSRDLDRLELAVPGQGWIPDARVLGVIQSFGSHFTETTVDSSWFRGRLIATTTTEAADRLTTRAYSVQPALNFRGALRTRLGFELRREETEGPRASDVTVRNAAGSVTSQTQAISENVPPAFRNSWAFSAFSVPLELPVRVELGARYDNLRSHADSTPVSHTAMLDVTEERWSGEAGLARRLGAFEPYARVASGFRAPNLDERYFNGYIHGGLRLFGNPDLDPERSLSYEAGLRVAHERADRRLSAQVSAFRSDVDDLISFVYLDMLYGVPRFQYVNVEQARIEGLEMMGRMQWGRYQVGLSATLPRGVDRSTGERLLDAGTNRVAVDLGVRTGLLPQGMVSARVRWSDAVQDVDPNFVAPAFSVTSLEVACVLAGTRVAGSIQNLWNHAYREPLSFIPEPGRTFAISLRHDFRLPLAIGG